MTEDLMFWRGQDAKRLSAWYAGQTDQHPHGKSGLRFLLPRALTSRVDEVDGHGMCCAREISMTGGNYQIEP